MADDVLDAIFASEKAIPVAETPAPQAETPAQEQAQPRGPDGKFVPKETAAPTPVEPAAPAPVATPVASKPQIDPEQFKGYLDEREKRQALERERDELKKQLASRTQPDFVPPPSIHDDPEGFAQYQADQVRSAKIEARFETSELLATQANGAEAVESAKQWALDQSANRPGFVAEYLKQTHPIDWAIKQQKRAIILEQIGDDPDAWARRRYEELNAAATPSQSPALAATPQPAASSAPPAPRPSLASAPNAGGVTMVPTAPGSAFDAVIRK